MRVAVLKAAIERAGGIGWLDVTVTAESGGEWGHSRLLHGYEHHINGFFWGYVRDFRRSIAERVTRGEKIRMILRFKPPH
jgi:hypothetical protein